MNDNKVTLPQPRWDAFIRNMIAGKSPIEAYKAVDSLSSTYTSVQVLVRRLFNNPYFIKCFSAAMKQANEQAIIKRNQFIAEEAKIAFSDISLIFDWDGETILPPTKLPSDIRPAIKSFTRRKVRGTWVYTYKFWDKNKARERLAKILGLYELDNQQKSFRDGNNVTIKVTVVD